jgi:hypothetical protein
MDFMKIIQSIDEFLYEVMSWLAFYPMTLWRSIRHPVQMLRYSRAELEESTDQQFTDLISPPLFLMITIMLSHVIEISAHSALPAPTTSVGKQIVASEQNMLFLRSILFAVYPLMFSVRRLRQEKKPLDRDTLRDPFFAQCYVAAPAALVVGIASILGRTHSQALQITSVVMSLGAAAWYIAVETKWLKIEAGMKTLPASWSAFRTWFLASMISSLLSVVVLGVSI